jgi:hypothetical protein
MATNANPFSSAEWLRSTRNLGYGPLPIPQPRDFEITDLLESWTKLNSSERESAPLQISHEQTQTLLAYGARMASLSVRNSDAKLIHYGLLAVGIDGWRYDWRENVTIVSLLYDAANRIGAEPGAIFESASALLADKSANGIRRFLLRSAEDKSLAAMCYIAGADSDGFRYLRTW